MDSDVKAEACWLAGEITSKWGLEHGRFVEVVGLGFRDEITGHIIWEALTNRASDPATTFDIDGFEIKGLLMYYGRRPEYLWHSHSITTGPSETDLESFPTWLTKVGVIYHAPSGETVLYNESGIISSTSNSPERLLATQHNTES